MFKPDRANGFDVQSEVDAYAEEELNRPKQLTAKARLALIYNILLWHFHTDLHVTLLYSKTINVHSDF